MLTSVDPQLIAQLKEVAQRLTNYLRKSDTVARMGGDEFTVIIPAFDLMDDVKQVAQKLIYSIARPYHIEDKVVYISASLGVATYPVDAMDCSTLAKMADTAMYAAKQGGKNRYMLYVSLVEPRTSDVSVE